MNETSRIRLIAKYLKRIEESKLSVEKFLQKYEVPFSRAQYFRYKKCYDRDGMQGLRDGRAEGNHRRLTPKAQSFLLGFHTANPNAKLVDYQAALSDRIGVHVDLATISRFFHAHNIRLVNPKPPQVETFEVSYGGFEIITALAWHLKWPEYTASRIQQTTEQLEQKPSQPPHARQTAEQRGRDIQGHFTARYNQRRDIRRNRFAAIADKRQGKDLSRLQVCQSGVDPVG